MANKDCFAYKSNNENGCSALKKLYCLDKGKCKFYKSKTEYHRQIQNSIKTLIITKQTVE